MTDTDTIHAGAMGKCDACEREFPADQLVVGPDPFAEEINHDDTPRTMCENCLHESAMDI